MMKKIYIASWFMVALGALVSIFTGTLTPAALVAYSLLALGLVFTLMLWSVIANTQEIKTE